MKIFVLLSRVPYPLEKGDKLRAYQFIKHLSEKHEIHLCALNDKRDIHPEAGEILHQFCKSVTFIQLSKLGIVWNVLRAFFLMKPLQVGYFYNKRAQQAINEKILEIKPDHIFCQLIRVSEYVKHIDIPKTLDYQDVFSKGVQRRLRTSPFYMAPVLYIEYKLLRSYERKVFDFFDHKVIISYPDREAIPHKKRSEIVVIPNGVDHSYFKPYGAQKKIDVVFIGNMSYPPNVYAAEYLVKKVLPFLNKENPPIRVLLAGAAPTKRVLSLKSKNVEVIGWIDDIRMAYASAKVFIAPMLLGTGMQNKLLEAMAMKIPCITSPLANAALKAKENEEILIAHTPEEYAQHILYLIYQPKQAERLSENAHRFVMQRYSWQHAVNQLDQLISQ